MKIDQIEHIAIPELGPCKRNARNPSNIRTRHFAESIETVGVINPACILTEVVTLEPGDLNAMARRMRSGTPESPRCG